MLIVCPTCDTSYQIKPAALGAGRQVRCSHCKNTWFATAESMMEEAAVLSVSGPAPGAGPGQTPDNFGSGAIGDIIPPPAAPQADNPFTVANAPPLVPQGQHETDDTAPKFDPGVPDHVEAIPQPRVRPPRADQKGRRGVARRLFSLPMLIVVFAAILLGALNWRASMVRQFPQTASLYAAIGLPVNLRGLFFENVRTIAEVHDGVTVLIVEGTIVNLTTRTLEVPRLRLSLRNGLGHEVYAWTALPPKATLGSGNGLPFRARLASPPPDGRDVIVRFFNRRDAVAGL
ncbi:MAG: thioredoxin [Alphaproteobacteria bacterium]|nr:MAG: thioredoxin [Alphaproteobacteria bacterium]